MTIVAKVQKLDTDYADFLVEWFQMDPPYFENEADARAHIVPYTLVIYNTSSAYISLAIGLIILLLFAAVGIVIFMKFKKEQSANTIPTFEQPANDFTIESKPSENGFGESHTPPQPVPMPMLSQPTDADEFFSTKPKVTVPVAEEEKKEENPPSVEEPVAGEMSGLDTTGLFDETDYETDETGSEFIE